MPHHEVIECNSNEFACMMDNMCIAMEYVCDGVRHCIDNSDEVIGCLNIKQNCRGFLCKNSHCLTDKSWVCDGTNDCGDWSDEKNCSEKIFLNAFHSVTNHIHAIITFVSVADCTVDNKKFLCGDNTTCISIEKVCNKEKDCKDGIDEGGICDKFNNNTACELHYCPNDAECYIWPTGPVCVCPKGYRYNSQKKTCEVSEN